MLLSHRLHLTHILRTTWRIELIMFLSCTGAFILDQHMFEGRLQVPQVVPTILGTAIAFFIGFNNNQAYDRWWEARIIWGSIVNNSRSWARNIITYCREGYTGDMPFTIIQKRMIRRQIGFVYALKASLRNKNYHEVFTYIPQEDIGIISHHTNKANAILLCQASDLHLLHRSGTMNELEFAETNRVLQELCNDMGRAERIKNTVFPTTYVSFTQLFIWLFVVLFTITFNTETGAWSVVLSWLIGFVFHTTNINGMLLMDPFEAIPTGVPLDQISRTIEINLLEVLRESNIPQPVQPINDEYIL